MVHHALWACGAACGACWRPKNRVCLLVAEALLRITASAKSPGSSSEATWYSSSSEMYLSEFKDAAMQNPGLSASDFKQVKLE